MNDDVFRFLVCIVLILVGFFIGLVVGHNATREKVATDCIRLGAFYVDQKTFECKEKP